MISIPAEPQPGALALTAHIEALLFVAAEALTLDALVAALLASDAQVRAALGELASQCAGRGVRLQHYGEAYTLVSAPEAAAAVERLLGVQAPARLSAAALETLAIIAYRQPLTRARVEAVRGVDCGGVIWALLARELITEVGRLEAAGRPIIYATTPEFLRQFGLGGLHELPPFAGFGDAT